jgi:7,8-dihydroneopterin aldolase/epimerase/oxygenase
VNAPLDVVALRGLRVRGHHGVLPEERRDGQVFVVDAALSLDTRPAAVSDDLADAVNYAELAERLAAVVSGPPVDLIETLAARLVEVCLADARVARAEVTVHKPEAPVGLPFDDVTVSVVRERR